MNLTLKARQHLARLKKMMWVNAGRKRKMKGLDESKRAEFYLDRGELYRDIENGIVDVDDVRN